MTAILDILERRQQDWATLAKSDAAEAGTFARGFVTIHKGQAVYASIMNTPISIDEKSMCSYGWRISTSDMDREGDTIIPASPKKTLKNYTRNPVVSFDHFRQDPLPVGTSIGSNGMPLIFGKDYIEAGCKHHDKTAMARDVWNLVKAGVLRSASIAFLPLKAKQVGDIRKGSLKSPRFQFDEIDVTEWAICSVPVNPEAVRMEMSRGHIQSEELKKSLADFAEKPLEYAHGWSPQETETMSKTVNFRDIQAIRFAKSAFDQEKAQDFLKSIGGDASMVVENDTSFDFIQQPGEHKGSVKIGGVKGVQGLLLKSVAASVDGTVEKTLPIDETPEEVPAVVTKAEEMPKPEVKKPDAKKPAGDGRVTHAVQSWADVMNHSKGCSQYHTKAAGMLDHGPSMEMHKTFATAEKEKQEKIKAFVAEHFGDMDMDEVSAAQAEAAGKEKEGKEKKKSEASDINTLETLSKSLEHRGELIGRLEQSLEIAKKVQETVQRRYQLN